MRPFIPLNDKTAIALKKLPKGVDAFNHKGIRISSGGIPYAYWVSFYGKGHKYRCWFVAHKKECPCNCSNSPNGRIVYIKPGDDLRIEEGGFLSTKHRFIRSVIAGINIHLGAWLKHTDVKLMTLLEAVLPKASA